MDRDAAGLAEVGHRASDRPWDRFAHWPRGAARLALATLALLLVLAAIAPGYGPPPPAPPQIVVAAPTGQGKVERVEDNDMLLYRLINRRVRAGENYYSAAITEQRAHGYPVSPGFTVRLPTLAFAALLLGDRGMIALGIVLFAATMVVMFRRLGDEPGGADRAPMAVGLLMAGIGSALSAQFNVLHEIWAAQLLALSLALYRPAGATGPSRWRAAWLVAALALAVRELVLPYVLLMGWLALRGRNWRQALAWLGLAAAFAVALAMHLHLAEAWIRPGDPVSNSWLAVRGMAGLLYKIDNSTFLNLLPLWLAGPLVVLALFGWAGWDTPLGRIGFLVAGGYALGFMLFGRDNNFYWGLLLAPLLFMGAAFAPGALRGLWRGAALFAPPVRIAHV
ncbi:MAG TPA: hypothetical protein VI199_02645 [Novosphingobium sp.]